jgi:hypothetical protein
MAQAKAAAADSNVLVHDGYDDPGERYCNQQGGVPDVEHVSGEHSVDGMDHHGHKQAVGADPQGHAEQQAEGMRSSPSARGNH